MIFFRSVIYQVCFFLWTVPLCLMFLPMLVLPRSAAPPCARLWAGGVLWLMRHVVGIKWTVEGRENLPPKPFIIASKHQSAFETFTYPLLFPDPAFVLKRELQWLPFFGWYLAKTGVIAIDRSAGTRALKSMVKGAEAAKADSRIIIVFPEGTRAPVGERKPYHSGIAMMYGSLDLPVVPIALNSGLCWGKRAFTKRPGTITFRILPPIQPGLDRKTFMAQLESSIESATDELIRQP